MSTPPSSPIASLDHLDGRLGVGEVDAVDLGVERVRAVACQPLDVDVDQGELGTLAAERGGDLGADATGRAR